MPNSKTFLILAGLLGVGVGSVGTVQAFGSRGADLAGTGSTPPRLASTAVRAPADAGGTVYDEALAAATALRGRPAAAAVGRPVSLEFIVSLLRAVSFGPGPTAPAEWTLFLPTDAAFAPLAGGPLDALVHNPAALRAMLDRHLVADAWSRDQAQSGRSLTTLGGQRLEVEDSEGSRVNGADVLAEQRLGNGRVFIIDRLL
jgi:uncharacterized surface protein with fasciclin (FAS1) repeats